MGHIDSSGMLVIGHVDSRWGMMVMGHSDSRGQVGNWVY